MPPGKSSQSNTMLYSVITFVALFLIATTLAVIFYIKSEEHRTENIRLNEEMAKLASPREKPSVIVGKPLKEEGARGTSSYLGTMNTYLNEMIATITGQVAEDATADVKINDTKIRINQTMTSLGDEASAVYGPEGVNLLQTILNLKNELDLARQQARDMEKNLNDLQDQFDLAMESFKVEEDRLTEDLNRYQAEASRLLAKYNELEQLMQQSSDDQIQAYMDKLEKTEQRLEEKNMELLAAQAQLAKTNQELQTALNQLLEIDPHPGIDVMAYKPDASIIDIDRQTNVVYLDIGSDDHVYVGLTFSVYDKNEPIPEDGKGKAEIEIFDVQKTISAARINASSKKNPIVLQDIVANLIWNSKSSNKFVISGDFDFDGNGVIDHDGLEKNKRLIEYWGGTIVDQVTINTDFILIGERPQELRQPTRDQIDLDPTAETKYQESLIRAKRYDDIIAQANTLSIPIFNQRRFIHLIGYESLTTKNQPF